MIKCMNCGQYFYGNHNCNATYMGGSTPSFTDRDLIIQLMDKVDKLSNSVDRILEICRSAEEKK